MLHLVQTTLNTIYELVTRNCMNIPVRKCINYMSLKTFFLAIFALIWPYFTVFAHTLKYADESVTHAHTTLISQYLFGHIYPYHRTGQGYCINIIGHNL